MSNRHKCPSCTASLGKEAVGLTRLDPVPGKSADSGSVISVFAYFFVLTCSVNELDVHEP